jgi:hypothetical protein
VHSHTHMDVSVGHSRSLRALIAQVKGKHGGGRLSFL